MTGVRVPFEEVSVKMRRTVYRTRFARLIHSSAGLLIVTRISREDKQLSFLMNDYRRRFVERRMDLMILW